MVHSSVIQQYKKTRLYTESICKPLQIEDYVVQASEFASPAKWHLAHTTWFFETFILKEHFPDYKLYHPDFSFLFNSYYNNLGDRVFRADRGNITRPGVEEVYSYRAYVDKHMNILLNDSDSTKLDKLVTLGIHHEQQHQELLITDIKYMLANNPTFPVYDLNKNLVDDSNDQEGYVQIDSGLYTIGHQSEGFCYDNELGVHQVYLDAFEISNALVTNQAFMEFIADGGYENFNLWLDAGWAWVNENQVKAPLYWHLIDGAWHYYTLAGLQKVDPKAIVSHISFYEANAFARWKGMRLPTEFEWEVASNQLKWGSRWEWTYSAYLPYPKFKIAAGALGEYNGKFMINQMVLRGASVATSPQHSRYTYRNFFHPHERWQYTGLRLVK
jgi:ergothioneine biosynthesis protein EgtB